VQFLTFSYFTSHHRNAASQTNEYKQELVIIDDAVYVSEADRTCIPFSILCANQFFPNSE